MNPIRLLLLAVCATLVACMPDAANLAVSLPQPYRALPDPRPGAAIEAGKPVRLDARQQEAVVAGVTKWMKNPASVSFGEMAGARNRRGWITVCGEVNGRNSAGAYVGMSPFIGVLAGSTKAPDFVVVDIASRGQPRAEIEALCRESGIARGADARFSRPVR